MTAAQTGLIPDPRVSQGCREQVWLLLKDYPIEEVQAALNSLVANPKWLAEHRRASYTEQKSSEGQTSTPGSDGHVEYVVTIVEHPMVCLKYDPLVRLVYSY